MPVSFDSLSRGETYDRHERLAAREREKLGCDSAAGYAAQLKISNSRLVRHGSGLGAVGVGPRPPPYADDPPRSSHLHQPCSAAFFR